MFGFGDENLAYLSSKGHSALHTIGEFCITFYIKPCPIAGDACLKII